MLNTLKCAYIDTKTSRKSTIHDYAGKNFGLVGSPSHFIVSTCLRHEVYAFGPFKLPTHTSIEDPSLALERLLRLMCGLESDILGEQEILFQTERGIRQAFDKGTISRPQFIQLMEILTTAESIRRNHALTSKENYSTIGAELFRRHLDQRPSRRIMVIGAGYMSRVFLGNLKLANTELIWINRDTPKISKRHGDILSTYRRYTLAGIDGVPVYAPIVDGIFVAVSNYPHTYNSSILCLPNLPLIVDISYPIVFDDFPDNRLLNLNNTNFYRYLQSPPARETLQKVDHEIRNCVDKVLVT